VSIGERNVKMAEVGSLEGQVALVTGAARGQGHAHAIRLAAGGANILAIDLCGPVSETIPYESAIPALEASLLRFQDPMHPNVQGCLGHNPEHG
jgi:NAD(P)-dependent dehydrogenase (short-subunit alcohol dehydrogenase family)